MGIVSARTMLIRSWAGGVPEEDLLRLVEARLHAGGEVDDHHQMLPLGPPRLGIRARGGEDEEDDHQKLGPEEGIRHQTAEGGGGLRLPLPYEGRRREGDVPGVRPDHVEDDQGDDAQ